MIDAGLRDQAQSVVLTDEERSKLLAYEAEARKAAEAAKKPQ